MTIPNQLAKAETFRNLHQGERGFVIPNPWDVGSARMLELLGYDALATTSAGFAFSQGQPDNTMTRASLMLHLKNIADATDLPVSADLENGFGESPDTVAQTIRLAAATGVVGGSIEDSLGPLGSGLFGVELATERIRAAAEAAHSLPFPFTLTARAENYFIGRPDLAEVIRRLQAYQEAGADVLFAPGLTTKEDICAVVRSVDRPVNVLMGVSTMTLNLHELLELGVKRVSLGGSMARAAYGEFLRAACELRVHGTAGFANTAISGSELSALLRDESPQQLID